MASYCPDSSDYFYELQHIAANCDSVLADGRALNCQPLANPASTCGQPWSTCSCSFNYIVNGHSFGFSVVNPNLNPIYFDEVTLLLIAAAFVACVKFVIK